MKTNLYICEQRIPLTQQATLRQRLHLLNIMANSNHIIIKIQQS